VKIYTKTGDNGETSLHGGSRVKKDILRIEAYGTVDELNSIIGVCRSVNTHPEIDSILDEIQQTLFTLGADLSTLDETTIKNVQRIQQDAVTSLEKIIDRIDPQLKPLRNFILPGGSYPASLLHLARTVCRRAERLVVSVSQKEKINPLAIVYLNRLSDLLFVLARWSNALQGTQEVEWITRIPKH
jgi:cob(I)alamin adenosyltransferase